MVKQKFFIIFEQIVFKVVPGRLVPFLSSRLGGLVSLFSEHVAQSLLWVEVLLWVLRPVLSVSHSRVGSGRL